MVIKILQGVIKVEVDFLNRYGTYKMLSFLKRYLENLFPT